MSKKHRKRSKTYKNNHRNSNDRLFAKTEEYRGLPTYQIWKMYLYLRSHDCIDWVWPTISCKVGRSDPIVRKLKLDMFPLTGLNLFYSQSENSLTAISTPLYQLTECVNQVSNWYRNACWKNVRKTRTDGGTDIAGAYYDRFVIGRIKKKNTPGMMWEEFCELLEWVHCYCIWKIISKQVKPICSVR